MTQALRLNGTSGACGPGFDAAAWRAKFDASTAASRYGHCRRLRTEVQKGTLHALRTGRYVNSEGALVHLPQEQMEVGRLSAAVCSEDNLCPSPRARGPLAKSAPFGGTSVRVEEIDCLECAELLLKSDPGSHVAVLNMANATIPGGGWLSGAGAQEENLHRRTNLSDHLSNFRKLRPGSSIRYPIPSRGGIFSENVCVLRGSESHGYPFLPEPYLVSIISVAAYKNPACERGRLAEGPEKGTSKKINMMLRMAKHYGVDHIVLSAFGCGAFNNPPIHIAELFRDALLSGEFLGHFKSAVFAIIEDHNSRKVWAKGVVGNVAPFRLVFNSVIATPSSQPSSQPRASKTVSHISISEEPMVAKPHASGVTQSMQSSTTATVGIGGHVDREEEADDVVADVAADMDEIIKEVSAEMLEWGKITFEESFREEIR